MKVCQVEVGTLKPYANNSNKHSDWQIKKIADSIREFGFTQPVLITKDNVIIAGHGRALAAMQCNIKKIPAIRLDLPIEKARAYVIADNQLARLAEWDHKILASELVELQQLDYDIDVIGFDDKELAKIRNLVPDAGWPGYDQDSSKDDDVPETEENKFGVKTGDLWELGEHLLLCGDSTDKVQVDRLMGGDKADMVFTDPPYGVLYSGGVQFTKDGVEEDNRKKLENDSDVSIYGRVARVIKAYLDGPAYIWFSFSNAKGTIDAIDAIGNISALIIWNKTNAKYGALNAHYKQRHEPCLYVKCGKNMRWSGPTDERTVWDMKRDPRNDLHPTQKPVELAERAIGNHSAKTVLDLFLGSGSTLIACEKTNRKCYGMEIDPHYCSVIINRWQTYTGKQATLK